VSDYLRPDIPDQVFRDESGAVIVYGNRWGIDGPAEDSYSVDRHPERFAPVHRVADALIEHLRANYDVVVVEDPIVAADLVYAAGTVLRAIRLTPADPLSAPLTFVYTDYPGLVVHAGLLADLSYPICGCEACDETWQSLADELEWQIGAIVSGGYREYVRGSRHDPSVGFQITGPGRSVSRGGGADAPSGRIEDARARMPERWGPWPLR
jgi:hypothetical protein